LSNDRLFFGLGALLGALGVMAGAFGAHALRDQLTPDRLLQFELAVRYQMYHAFALLATGHAVQRWPASTANSAGWCFVAGVSVFCGTVYALAFGSPRWFGAITPIGGLALIVGWALLAYAAFYRSTQYRNSAT
jgi:uncharacterized membrane protein YgdD (TMEM256/DUF423 family)